MKSPTQKALECMRTRCPGFMCGCCGGRSFHMIDGKAFTAESIEAGQPVKVITLWCQDCAHLHSFLHDAGDGHANEAA
jgi:hypothetical protein